MVKMLTLNCGADLFKAESNPESVFSLFELVQGRMEQSRPRPLVVVEGSQRTVRQVSERLAEAPVLSDVILATSGSSGASPNLVGLSWQALVSSATETDRYLNAERWLLALPTHHIAGFQIIVRSALLGENPLFARSTTAISKLVADVPPGTVASLVPTQLRALVNDPLENLHALLVGGARLPGELRERAKHLPLVTTYGMTETSGGCVYDGKPLPGTKVRIEDGRVLLSGPTLMDGYVDAESPFTEICGARYLVTNDAGTWDGNKLRILGRVDQVIISGGENLNPEHIEQVIESELPDMQVAVLGVPDRKWGQVVCAAVVVKPGQLEIAARQIRATVSAGLSRKAAPRRIVALTKMPLLANGKVDLQTLRQQVLEAVQNEQAWSAD